jgi:hypothetical protein
MLRCSFRRAVFRLKAEATGSQKFRLKAEATGLEKRGPLYCRSGGLMIDMSAPTMGVVKYSFALRFALPSIRRVSHRRTQTNTAPGEHGQC